MLNPLWIPRDHPGSLCAAVVHDAASSCVRGPSAAVQHVALLVLAVEDHSVLDSVAGTVLHAGESPWAHVV